LEPAREADGHITLRMRVIGPRDKGIEFVRNLEHSRRFLTPRITGETAENTNGPGQNLQPVSNTNRFSFNLLADYNPPTTDEVKAAGNANEASGGSRQGQREAANHHESGHSPAVQRTGSPDALQTKPRAGYKRP